MFRVLKNRIGVKMNKFNKLYNLILQSLEQYQPPYNQQQLRQNGYDQETIQRLKKDPVHAWRMQTGIQLIHKQPTKSQLERIWNNWQLMDDEQKTKSNQKCMQLFGVTNQFLYGYLIPQYKVDRPSKDEIKYNDIIYRKKYDDETSNREYIWKLVPFVINQKDDKVYLCRTRLYDKIEGKHTSSWSGEQGNVFVTPFKGIASCFVISRNQILRKFEQLGYRVQHCNFKYDVWNKPNEQLLEVAPVINVTIQRSGLKCDQIISGVATGYLYTIDFNKYKEHCHMFNKNPNSDVEFCIQGDVEYQKVQKITVNWTCNIQN